MKTRNKIILITAGVLVFLAGVFALTVKHLYTRKTLGDLVFEPDYYWPEEKSDAGKWKFRKTYAGYDYFLYLPPQYKDDQHNAEAKLPLFVLFHGSYDKGIALGRYGRMFAGQEVQSIRPCAVLVLLARVGYYSDCHDTSMLIQNVLMQNECIDKTSIIAYGHSQGAYYAVKMACYQRELFKAVISGSGYYTVTKKELLKLLPVQFWFGLSENDKGIYEQGCKTGPLLEKYCKNSVYALYKNRGHFYVELKDVAPQSGVAFIDWLNSVLNDR